MLTVVDTAPAELTVKELLDVKRPNCSALLPLSKLTDAVPLAPTTVATVFLMEAKPEPVTVIAEREFPAVVKFALSPERLRVRLPAVSPPFAP